MKKWLSENEFLIILVSAVIILVTGLVLSHPYFSDYRSAAWTVDYYRRLSSLSLNEFAIMHQVMQVRDYNLCQYRWIMIGTCGIIPLVILLIHYVIAEITDENEEELIEDRG